jgi:hypothetical protein
MTPAAWISLRAFIAKGWQLTDGQRRVWLPREGAVLDPKSCHS